MRIFHLVTQLTQVFIWPLLNGPYLVSAHDLHTSHMIYMQGEASCPDCLKKGRREEGKEEGEKKCFVLFFSFSLALRSLFSNPIATTMVYWNKILPDDLKAFSYNFSFTKEGPYKADSSDNSPIFPPSGGKTEAQKGCLFIYPIIIY